MTDSRKGGSWGNFAWFALAVLAGCTFTQAQTPLDYGPVESTEQMVSTCREVPNAAVGQDGQVRLKDSMDNGLCWGYFSVFPIIIRTTYDMHSGNSATYPFRVCVGHSGLTVNQIVAIFLEYAKRHPERYRDDAFLVGMEAMKEAFPCPAHH